MSRPDLQAELIVALDSALTIGAELALRSGEDTFDQFNQQTLAARAVLAKARRAAQQPGASS